MSGQKILDGLRDAQSGNFAAVTIEGQRWGRAPEWQPIESAPKDGTMILASLHWLPYPKPLFWAKYADEWRCPAVERISEAYSPTHWMPLPEPPVTP